MNIEIAQTSGVYILRSAQQFPGTIQNIWNYFATPVNLQSITPKSISFEITSGAEGEIYPGKIISYNISLLPFIKNKWITEITQVIPLKYFIDEQRTGPYTLWHHEHHFKENETGVVMTDIVTYKLPLGLLGRLVAGGIIRKQLLEIFSFRYKVLQKQFG